MDEYAWWWGIESCCWISMKADLLSESRPSRVPAIVDDEEEEEVMIVGECWWGMKRYRCCCCYDDALFTVRWMRNDGRWTVCGVWLFVLITKSTWTRLAIECISKQGKHEQEIKVLIRKIIAAEIAISDHLNSKKELYSLRVNKQSKSNLFFTLKLLSSVTGICLPLVFLLLYIILNSHCRVEKEDTRERSNIQLPLTTTYLVGMPKERDSLTRSNRPSLSPLRLLPRGQ